MSWKIDKIEEEKNIEQRQDLVMATKYNRKRNIDQRTDISCPLSITET